MKSLVFAPLLACALLTMPAWGQPIAIPKNPCEKPEDFPGKLASDTMVKAWNKSMENYTVCIKKFATEQKAIVDAATKAGNDAVEEYNATVNKAKETMEKSKANP